MLVIIPDEFQVNDELFEVLMKRVDDPGSYDREYPQMRIRGFARERSIQVLDLLDAQRGGQGAKRVYHLRDTHWNARGNRIAGEALAQFLLRSLSSGEAGWGLRSSSLD